MKQILPNYKNGSILNLVSSIAKALGTRTEYNTLKILNPKELKNSKNIVLIVADGLGYEYLKQYGRDSFLYKYIKGKITSVFPSATTAAIPCFSTGYSCLKHEMTSWYSYLKELGQVIIPLPYTTRIKPRQPLGEIIKIKNVFNIKPFVDKTKISSYVVTKKEILNSDFSVLSGGKAKRVGYKDIKGFFKKLGAIIKSNNRRKYIYAYFPEHDHLCHKKGVNSRKVLINFRKFDKELKRFADSIKGADTKIIITADHGLIDVPKSRKIKIRNHLKLAKTLSAPICGDFRYGFCFVKASKKKQFEKYVKTKLKKYCSLYKSEDLVKKGYFGLEKPSKKFLERIGDYTLLMKENYGIYENLIGEKERYNVGEHGGLSEEEMLIPVIFIEIKS